MKKFIILINVLLCFGLTRVQGVDNGQSNNNNNNNNQDHNNNDRINEGASTSTGHREDCGHCEIQNIAHRIVVIMTSEDVEGGDLEIMMNNRYNELEAFYDEISTYVNSLEAGVPREERTRRLQYFLNTVDLLMHAVIEKASSSHYRFNTHYEYNAEDKKIYVREKIGFSCGECVCSNNHRERTMLSLPLGLPAPKQPQKKFELMRRRGSLTIEETTIYHIIPLPLISRFFHYWLTDALPPNYAPDEPITDCSITLIGRIRRSMQKLLLVSLRRSRAFSDRPGTSAASATEFEYNPDEVFSIQNLENAVSWLSGNIFIGPTDRGPTNPTAGRTGEQLYTAFEYNSDAIIGIDRYLDLLVLFNQILDWTTRAPHMSIADRLMSGFRIFTTMALRLHFNGVTPLNMDDWDQRTQLLTLQDLTNYSPEELRRMRNRKYWVFKRQNEPENRGPRGPRSVKLNFTAEENMTEVRAKREALSETTLKTRWTDFVLDMSDMILNARSNGRTLDWSCNFTALYNRYLFKPLVPNFENPCALCINLDEFFYKNISRNSKWYSCNYNPEITVTTRWCSAWRRTLANMDRAENDFDDPANVGNPRWMSLSEEDVGILVRWLLDPNGSEVNTIEEHLVTLPEHPFAKHPEPGSVDIAWCLATSLIPTILTWEWQQCKKSMSL